MRTETITFRLSEAEKELLVKQAQEKDMALSKYIYRLIFPKQEEE